MSQHAPNILVVSADEHNSKLFRFLERRIEETNSTELHKWIRTGQVRVNGGRCKPFQIVVANDEVRVPPFACPREVTNYQPSTNTSAGHSTPQAENEVPFWHNTKRIAGLSVISHGDGYFILDKPAGLAVQGGSNITESVTDILKTSFKGSAFVPAPVHRLDKDTSGLLVVATSQQGAQRLSAAFASTSAIGKEYFAVVSGQCDWASPTLLYDKMYKHVDKQGNDFLRCKDPSGEFPLATNANREQAADAMPLEANASLVATVLSHLSITSGGKSIPASLLHIQLLTGKKHQIRLQLSSRGFPIVGDVRYKGPNHSPLLLHAFAISMNQQRVTTLPAWPAPIMDHITKSLHNISVMAE